MPATAADRDLIVRLYREGVDAVVVAAEQKDAARTWATPACGVWTALDTVHHVLAVAGWYHDWLDRALDGDATPPFGWEQVGTRNAEEIAALDEVAGVEAAHRFAERAEAYVERAVDHWDLPFGFPRGTVTVGLHLGAAAAEWHLHAWDLDPSHRPSDPGALFRAMANCVAETEPRLRRLLLLAMVSRSSKRAPWTTMLRRSGRR